MIAAGPTPLWYVARSTGYVSLLLLTAILVVGILTALRFGNREWPRFLVQAVHRNLSLLVLVFLAIHVVTAVVDPFAGITVLNAILPFTGSYRPIWLGLGVVALELMVALTVTSLVRHRISYGMWRVIHWLAYLSWPAAILHTIGTGSDVRSFWAVSITLICVGAVFAATCWRLFDRGGRISAGMRLTWTAVLTAATISVLGFAVAGPLQPGWARAAGTPSRLLTSTASSPPPAPTLASNIDDTVTGTVTNAANGAVQANLTSTRDPNLRAVIQVATEGQSGQLVITENGSIVCNATATIGSTVTATCGNVSVAITLTQQRDGSLTGTLQTSAASG
ncbi:MAG: ferric reductase-like transmembrane domain-containing protein [Candidatus Dormibacteria bacterium]